MPTFGRTATTGTRLSGTLNAKYAGRFYLSEPALVTKISFYTDGSDGYNVPLRGVIYADNAGVPGAKLAEGTEVRQSTNTSWRESNLTPIFLAVGWYWLGVIEGVEGAGIMRLYGDWTTGSFYQNSDVYGDGATDPFGSGTASTGSPSIYATYSQVTLPGGFRSMTNIAGDGSLQLGTTKTLNKPAGTVEGDYMVAAFSVAGNVGMQSVPSGWTLVWDPGGTSVRFRVYVKLAGANEPASYTWVWNEQIAFYNLVLMTFKDIYVPNPLDSGAGGLTAFAQPNGSTIGRSITTTGPLRKVVSIFFSYPAANNDAWFTYNQGTDVFQTSGNDGTDETIALNMLDAVNAGSVTINGTSTNAGGNHDLGLYQFAFMPQVIPLGKSTVLPWVNLDDAGASLAQPYAMVPQVGKALSLSYALRTVVGRSVVLTHTLIARLAKSLGLVYAVAHASVWRAVQFRYGIGEAAAIPGRMNADNYGDGASDPFGSSEAVSTEMTVFGTYFAAWSPIPRSELETTRLPFGEAQQDLALARRGRSYRTAVLGWHGTRLDSERGAVALVQPDGALADLVGKRVLIVAADRVPARSILAYVVRADNLGADDEDMSVPRRLFLALAPLRESELVVQLEPLIL